MAHESNGMHPYSLKRGSLSPYENIGMILGNIGIEDCLECVNYSMAREIFEYGNSIGEITYNLK